VTARLFRRLFASLLVVWAVASATFFLASLAPGDLATKLADPRIPPAARERLREHYGLHRPLGQRYLAWLSGVVTGNLGDSFLYRRPVTQVLAQALPNTALLASVGLGLELVLGVVLGLVQVRRPHGFWDRVLSAFSLTAYALPTFLVAAGLLWLFAYRWPVFPASHMTGLTAPADFWTRLADRARHLALPAITVGVTGCGAVARYLRGALLDEQAQAYILGALARGASRRRVLLLHALPNAALPLLTVLGLSLPFLVSGTLVIEVLFSWPGMGQVFYSAVTARDIPLIQAATILVTAAVVAGNWLADAAYALADPRIRR